MDSLWYRGFDSANKVESAKAHVLAAARRLLRAAELGLAQVPGEAGQRLRQIFDADSLWALAIVMAAWAVATLVGGPLALAVDVFLVGLGLVEAYKVVISASRNFAEFASRAYQGSSDADLAAAGTYFAQALAEVGVATLEAFLTSAAFRTLRTRVLSKFPRPAPEPSGVSGRPPAAERPPGTERPPNERPATGRTPPAAERAPAERAPADRERLPGERDRGRRFDRADRIAAEGLRGIGAVRAAKELERLPGALVLGTGAALSLLLTGGLVYAGYSYSQRLREARKAREDAKKGG